MKMKFRGWRREIYPHTHEVEPVKKTPSGYGSIAGRKSLAWTDGTTALGKVKGLALSGDFLVEFTFTEAELKDWMRNYFRSNPEEAAAMVSELQLESISTLAKAAARAKGE